MGHLINSKNDFVTVSHQDNTSHVTLKRLRTVLQGESLALSSQRGTHGPTDRVQMDYGETNAEATATGR